MDKVQKHNSFNTNTPSSESYKSDWSASHHGRFSRVEKSPRYPFDRRLGGPRSRLWTR